jgi:hypothetical protein
MSNKAAASPVTLAYSHSPFVKPLIQSSNQDATVKTAHDAPTIEARLRIQADHQYR